jgi:hypothetical protein
MCGKILVVMICFPPYPPMSTSVFLKLKDGRALPLREKISDSIAAGITACFERWIQRGMTLSIADAHGQVEDIPSQRVLCLETVREPDPPEPRHG